MVLALLAIVALPLVLWLLFAADTWLAGEWRTASYAVGWTFKMAVLASGYLIAIIIPSAIIAAIIWSHQERRARRRGWR